MFEVYEDNFNLNYPVRFSASSAEEAYDWISRNEDGFSGSLWIREVRSGLGSAHHRAQAQSLHHDLLYALDGSDLLALLSDALGGRHEQDDHGFPVTREGWDQLASYLGILV